MINKVHHPNTIRKADIYIDNPNNFFQIKVAEYNEFGKLVVVCKDDKEFVKDAYLTGYEQAREDSRLSWQDISDIVRIAFSMYPNLREIDYDSESVFKKIADKANKEKFGKYYI